MFRNVFSPRPLGHICCTALQKALFPAVRALAPEDEIAAMGASCRYQIAGATGHHARHLVEVLADALDSGEV